MNGKAILSLFFTLFVLFILCSFPVVPVLSENENVVINEFDLDPPGEPDSCICTIEWVELYNPTSNNIDIGGWTVTTSQGRNVTIPEGTVIATQGFYVIDCPSWNDSEWLANENESIVLIDADENEKDITPSMSDNYNDTRTWSRVPDGEDNWVFQTSTKGSFNVNQLPEADFSFYPPNPTPGENVQFTDLSQDVDGYIAGWLWDFDDGQTSNVQHPNHSYTSAGSYMVWLTVTDDNNATGKTWKEIVVTKNATQPEKNATQLDMILPLSIKVGQPLNITAILKDDLGNPLEGETVNFYVDEEPIASNVTNFEGVASVTYIPTKSGVVLLKASYNGSSQYTGSSKEAFLTIEEEEKPDWTPYILGGTTTVVVLGSVILMVKYRKKKKAQQSNASLQERNHTLILKT